MAESVEKVNSKKSGILWIAMMGAFAQIILSPQRLGGALWGTENGCRADYKQPLFD